MLEAATVPSTGNTPEEIYRFHVWLGAVKRCAECGEMKPVQDFGAYGVDKCQACRERAQQAPEAEAVAQQQVSAELEDYWAALNRRVAVGAG